MLRSHRLKRRAPGPKTRFAALPQIQQPGNLRRTGLGHGLPAGFLGDRAFIGQGPECQRWSRLPVNKPLSGGTFGLHRAEGQWVVISGTKQERPFGQGLVGLGKYPVDAVYHGDSGAVVGAQRVGSAADRPTGIQIGVDVGATETVNRLFGIANHQQAGVLVVAGHPVYTVEDPVLHRVGILEFIDHCHRKLATNGRCQAFALRAAQRSIQSCEQVVKAHTGQALLFAVQATGDPAGGVV